MIPPTRMIWPYHPNHPTYYFRPALMEDLKLIVPILVLNISQGCRLVPMLVRGVLRMPGKGFIMMLYDVYMMFILLFDDVYMSCIWLLYVFTYVLYESCIFFIWFLDHFFDEKVFRKASILEAKIANKVIQKRTCFASNKYFPIPAQIMPTGLPGGRFWMVCWWFLDDCWMYVASLSTTVLLLCLLWLFVMFLWLCYICFTKFKLSYPISSSICY